MFEKVNPMHPDKIADRIAGAIVDMAYKADENPKIAVEVLIGHGNCHVIIETSLPEDAINADEIQAAVERISGMNEFEICLDLQIEAQDEKLNKNQDTPLKVARSGDNGIFKGMPINYEEIELTRIAKDIYREYPTDGKYIIDTKQNFDEVNDSGLLVICQSQVDSEQKIKRICPPWMHEVINPIGSWTGGLNVDTGATNRKLGSDMGTSVTGGGLHGKDLSKADVTLNIYAFLKAQQNRMPVEIACAIGDSTMYDKYSGEKISFAEAQKVAAEYIDRLGGFEKFAEWGLIR